MKSILQNIRRYFAEINKWVLIAVSVFTAAGIIINYHFSLDAAIRKNNSVAVKLICWYAVFLAAFSSPSLITLLARPLTHSDKKKLSAIYLVSPVSVRIKTQPRHSFTFF